MELHDGTVEVSSAGLGHGSEFVVRLPFLAVTPEPPPEPPLDPSAGVPPMTDRRILVVDDNRDSAESLADLLKLTGNETSFKCSHSSLTGFTRSVVSCFVGDPPATLRGP